LLVVLGILFYVDAHDSDILRGETAADSRTGSVALFASAVFVLFIYWLILPRTIAVSQEGIVLQFSGFRWKIPFATIESIKAARGVIVWWGHSFITCYATQIEIRRRYRLKIRVSPARRHQFLEHANKALAGWRMAHTA
jgi:Bacterial PH domain